MLGGSYQHKSGIYYDSLHTVHGNCDSVIVTNLTVNNPYPYTDTVHVNVYDTVRIAVTDTLIINAVLTGINPPSNVNTIKVYPNPAKDHISIYCGNYATLNGYQIKIINTLSQSVFQTTVNQQSYYIDLSTFNGSGTYFLQLYDNQSHLIDVRKIILQ